MDDLGDQYEPKLAIGFYSSKDKHQYYYGSLKKIKEIIYHIIKTTKELHTVSIKHYYNKDEMENYIGHMRKMHKDTNGIEFIEVS